MTNFEPILKLLSDTRSQFIAITDAFPTQHWRESPGDGRWSAGQIVAHTMQVEESIIAGSRKTLKKPPYPVPFLKRFHLPLTLVTSRSRKWLRLIAYHELRHAKQIREVAEIFHR